MQPSKDDIKGWLKEHGRSREWLGTKVEVSLSTINKWLMPQYPIPTAKLAFIQRLMKDDEKKDEPTIDELVNNLIVSLTPEELAEYEKQALNEKMTLTAWVKFALAEYAKLQGITIDAIAAGFLPDPAPEREQICRYEYPLLRAAAGSPTLADADTLEHHRDLGHGRYFLELVGDSMQPTFRDKQRIIIRSKDSLKRPLLKKGELYHFIIDGKTLFKRYNTRRATPQEIAAGTSYTALDGTQKVKILESLNPAHPAITLTEPIEWLGWYDAEDNQLNGVVHP